MTEAGGIINTHSDRLSGGDIAEMILNRLQEPNCQLLETNKEKKLKSHVTRN
jgi:hypothetical protein